MCKTSKICKAKGCHKRILREGFCKLHLTQFLNGETVDVGESICIIEDCNDTSITFTGLCARHKSQLYNYGKAYTEAELKEFKPKLFCKVEGCLNRKGKEGYCEEHSGLREEPRSECKDSKCDKLSYKNDLCRQHYMESLDFSILDGIITPYDKENRTSDTWCKIRNCNSRAKYKGYCSLHARLIIEGNLETYMKKHGKGICSVEDCTDIVKAKGYCLRHYQQYNKFGKALTNAEHKEITPRYYCIEEGCSDKREFGKYCGKHAVEHKNDQEAICYEKSCQENIFKDGKCVKHYYDSMQSNNNIS
ncbi:hypothetical protein P9X10_02780 [Bacillus cereus]|nr:hypothetical protein [Bacillus cereus]